MNLAEIEIPKGSFYKYEKCKETGKLIIDRVLPIPCPYNYGFIPETLSADGDPLDIFIMSEEPIVPGAQVKLNPWGVLLCKDNGVEDNKVIATIEGSGFRDYYYMQTIKFYLLNYKKGFVIEEYKIFNDSKDFQSFISGAK